MAFSQSLFNASKLYSSLSTTRKPNLVVIKKTVNKNKPIETVAQTDLRFSVYVRGAAFRLLGEGLIKNNVPT